MGDWQAAHLSPRRQGGRSRAHGKWSRRVERLVTIAQRAGQDPLPSHDSLRNRYTSLSEKYADAVERNKRLTEKYTGVVRSLHRHQEEELGLRMLAAWALRSTSSGFALVHGDRISTTNVAFLTMDRPSSADERWERVSTDEPAEEGRTDSYAHLRSLVLGEASRAVADGAPYQAQFARESRLVTVSVERSDRLGSTFALVTLRDDTDLATARASASALEEKLLQQERVRTLGGLAMGIVHDLNNVLGSLAMRFDVLQRDAVYRVSQARNLDLMSQIIRSCTARVRTLHSLVRAPDPSTSTVDLAEIVSSAVEIAESGFLHGSKSGSTIRVQTELPELPKVNGSADELRHVFINLLVNARDAMADGGTITIKGSRSATDVRLAFEDEGPGISPEHFEHIFEPFFTTKGANGTGIGLAVAKETIERFGGCISAQNLPGGGASFELRFVASPM